MRRYQPLEGNNRSTKRTAWLIVVAGLLFAAVHCYDLYYSIAARLPLAGWENFYEWLAQSPQNLKMPVRYSGVLHALEPLLPIGITSTLLTVFQIGIGLAITRLGLWLRHY
ncbi:hypothetical protein [Vogesella sp. LIG4]|uniref:hypothetical protein n=1 Tax=Vogesella sp. LIG4 TaxID=1192162 RepID=UPI00081FAA00|nr:hypothetical protein [Vogesella sp. LIG4]SCK21141.1 hypothetical protein PSELUDRAFT_2380 [Vogesella sp. LIG4]